METLVVNPPFRLFPVLPLFLQPSHSHREKAISRCTARGRMVNSLVQMRKKLFSKKDEKGEKERTL